MSKPSLSKALAFRLTVVSIIMTTAIGTLWGFSEYSHFNDDISRIRQDYEKIQKQSITNIAESAGRYIQNQIVKAGSSNNSPSISSLQSEVLEYLSYTQYNNDGYIFAATWDGLSLAGPAQGKNVLGAKDIDGMMVVQELIKMSKSGGGFLKYHIPASTGAKPIAKISYVIGIPEWEWYIGAGFDLEELEEQVSELQAETQQHVRSVLMIVSISVVVLILALILTAQTEIKRIRINYQKFMDFFNSVDLKNSAIDTKSMRFIEFEEIALAANKMVAHRLQAEEAQSESKARLNAIFDNAPVEMYLKDVEGRYVQINHHFEKLFNVKNEELVGKFPADAHDPELSKLTRAHDLEVLKTGKPIIREEQAMTESGPRVLHTIKFPVFDEDKKITGLGAVVSDITEHKIAEETLKNALGDAERANQAKSEFLASMSHELRTPLNAILGFSDILHNQYFGPPGSGKYREYAADIHHSGKHLLELVNDILDISSIEAGKTPLDKELLTIKTIIDDCNRIVSERALSKGIQLEAIVANDLPPLYADKRAVKQMLLNLLSNAIKFTQNDGKITVNADAIDTGIRIEVIDNGSGIPPEKLTEVTDPFTKGINNPHLAEQGWGLGLSITKSLVELHDGVMTIESEAGKGTSVIIELPSSEVVNN